jgi:hypothetical protein
MAASLQLVTVLPFCDSDDLLVPNVLFFYNKQHKWNM